MPLFEIAIMQRPTKKEAEEGGEEKLIFGPKFTVAKDKESAALRCLLAERPEGLDMVRAEVLVRPFA
jgi:hypothetical protein